MNARTIKEQIAHSISQIEKGIAAMSSIVVDDANSLGAERASLQAQLQKFGQRLSRSSRIARKEVASELHRHPYAISGTAFAVGALAIALLWRNGSRQ